ncbi:putative amidohydrolase YtcJ [Kribbella aluminosa]|uniref:Amidohydrolase YtcJ n=1 Tax=Kribbella aluminosa TaxID=416017 RepID=A0ABS4UW87_9ACTN|nr:amidohydrolase [Kribbella aluminosa]MBP2355892.1 putative amidohydrolase YtcJ [Kribbella aluminosa]
MSTDRSGRSADMVLRGVVRPDAYTAPTDAVAVRDGVVVALGRRACDALVGRRTEVVDGLDGVVTPGFVDAHVHPVMAGLNRLRCDLDDLHGLDDYRRRITEHQPGDGEWFLGSGWYGDVFPGGFPSAAELDRLVGARPAVLTSHDAHGVWVNTAALRRAGIDDATPDPAGGRIHRDEHGHATGFLMESAADLVTGLVPKPGRAELVAALLEAQRYLHSLGIVGWQDAAVGEMLGVPDLFPVYREAAESQRLTAKVTGALWWDLDQDLSQLDLLLQRRAESEAWPHFRASAVKIMQDGVCENLTAAVIDHYHGRPGERGLSFVDPEFLGLIAKTLTAEGFDLHLHAVGDRAVRECLDAIEAAAPRRPDARHQLAHLDLIDPADVPRLAELGVIANIQPLWAREDQVLVETKLPYLTDAQRRHHFAFGSLHAAGAELAMGSDWPVSSPNPLWGMHVAVNRTAPDGDPHAQDEHARTVPLLPDEGVDVATAFHAATAGAARASRLDGTGTLRPGAPADLVVLDQDPFTVSPAELSSVTVLATYVDGTPVHH